MVLLVLLVSISLIHSTLGSSDHVKEMGFKFWLAPGMEECYHELLEKGSTLYFMFEILNPHHENDHLVAYFRNAYNGSILATAKSPHRAHLEFAANETVLIDICLDQRGAYTYVKYLSVFFHVYHVDRVIEKIKDFQQFDSSSIQAKNSISSIVHHILLTREHQIELQMINQKDLYLIEQTSQWINRWAVIHIVIIFICSLFQTYFIKRLFKTTRK